MSTRISKAGFGVPLLVAGLFACAPESGTPEGESVACALDGSNDFEDVCVLELLNGAGSAFAIHHPDGGFRRFVFEPQSRAITLGDGSEAFSSTLDPSGEIAVLVVGRDRYRVGLSQLGRKAE